MKAPALRNVLRELLVPMADDEAQQHGVREGHRLGIIFDDRPGLYTLTLTDNDLTLWQEGEQVAKWTVALQSISPVKA
jgi:hypothetical protein